ncbi:MAG: cupin domain-containing protein [Salinirussus sp.]
MATGSGHGVVTVATPSADSDSDLVTGSLTANLVCTELRVEAVKIAAGESLTLERGDERIVVPLLQDGAPGAAPRQIGRAPPGAPMTIEASAELVVLVVRTRGTDHDADVRWLSLTSVEFSTPSTSQIATAHLTEPLGCDGLKVNARRLVPGQAVPLHTEGRQEELFVPLDDGSMRIGDRTVETPPGTIVRVAPDTPRSARNDGSTSAVWLMFGAPPTGGSTDWDPGATVIESSGVGS